MLAWLVLKVKVGLTVNSLCNPTVRWLGWVACETHLLVCSPCSLINPIVLAWLSFVAPLAMYDSDSVPLFLEEIMPNSGVAVSLRDWWVQWPMKPIYWDVFPYNLINPTVLAWLSVIAPWLCLSLLVFPYSLRKSCLARGWRCHWDIDELIGLWLSGTLQRHSWLRDKFCSR